MPNEARTTVLGNRFVRSHTLDFLRTLLRRGGVPAVPENPVRPIPPTTSKTATQPATPSTLEDFNIPALMSMVSRNAWSGIEPMTVCIAAGDDVIKISGYMYEPFYEDFSSTASVSLNDEVLYGVDSRSVAPYRHEVYHLGRYDNLQDAISFLKEKTNGVELSFVEKKPQPLNDRLEAAARRSAQTPSSTKETVREPSL